MMYRNQVSPPRDSCKSDYNLHINFISVSGDIPDYQVYRKEKLPGDIRPDEEVSEYKLPLTKDYEDPDQEWKSYWVSMEEKPDYEPCILSCNANQHVTCKALFWTLMNRVSTDLNRDDYVTSRSSFQNELSLIEERYSEGHEELIIKPYYLKALQRFGFLFDFHFHKDPSIPFSRQIQQRSLHLDKFNRRNLDYYVDRYRKIQNFYHRHEELFSNMVLPGCPSWVTLEKDLVSLPASRLKTKVYLFSGNKESKSQFSGLKCYGPLKPLSKPPVLLFIFREQDRQAARHLALNLKGKNANNRYTFPGFSTLFKCEPIIDRNPVVLPELDSRSIKTAVESAKQKAEDGSTVVPVIVVPDEKEFYLTQKALFSNAEIATQVCTIQVVQDENALKWAIANIALQIFCKAGGYPWKVLPSGEKTLIIGISQSHKLIDVEDKKKVDKYFAFSVLTDSSGLFQRIQILGEHREQEHYIEHLRRNLRSILNESKEQYSRVVVHTSFKLKRREIDAIQDTVKEAANDEQNGCQFAVVKVNQKSKFFGVNRSVNSLVPYEATKVKLGPREYLIWFEGIFPDKPTVNKAIPGPTHLQILRVSDENQISDEVLLQDLVNLSGANWRGFNAKNTPVSVFYCHLVANLVHDFHDRNLPLPAVKDIKPWFL